MYFNLLTFLLWTAAISSGLTAGIYFAFSVVILPAFSKIPVQQSVTAMNSINTEILHTMFVPLFFGSSITSLLLVITSVFTWDEPSAIYILSGGAIYLIGMFCITALVNVPLNHLLAEVDPTSANAIEIWSNYRNSWTLWNHVRTIASLFASVLFIWILVNG